MDTKAIQRYCQTLPGTIEDLKWGCDLCFCVGKKMYAVLGIGEEKPGLSFKVSPEDFAVLTEHPEIIPAPYLARYHWVCLNHTDVLTDKDLKQRLADSYQMIFDRLPKKIRQAIVGA